MKHSFIGIDPGLVDTGVVAFVFDDERHHLLVDYAVFDGKYDEELDPTGPDIKLVKQFCNLFPQAQIFIEAYRPRSHFGTDARMGEIVSTLKKALPGSKVIDNTGVKKVIKTKLMKLLNVWDFGVSTHHQDLRAAARIGLYGAVKDNTLNGVVYDFTTEYLDGTPWDQERRSAP